MGSEWRTLKLIDAPLDIIDGDRGKNYPKQQEFGDSGYCIFLNAGNVTEDGFNFSQCSFIGKDRDELLRKGKLHRYDVVLTTRGTVGNSAYYSDDVKFDHIRINSGMVILRSDKQKLLPRYLYLYIRSGVFLDQVESLRTGSAQPQLPIRDINRIEIPTPPLPEQRAIAHILGSLDDKIELNRRMNRTLEAMAQAIFKSWFVDFDPVKARMEGRDTGLPAEIAELFPDSFEESELGLVPKGWRVRTIGDLAEIVGGSTPRTKNSSFWDGGKHHWATPKDLSTLSVPILLETERCITHKGLSQISSGLLPIGTVLLSSRAPIGYLAISEIPVAINQGFIAMKANPNISNIFLVLWAKFAHDIIISRANGSTFLEISKKNFRPIPIVTPTDKIMQTFDKIIRPLYDQITSNEYENKNLITARDTLLPKLISGELRVPDVEGFIKEAGL